MARAAVSSSTANPEVNRAVGTLELLKRPFAPVANPSNRPIAWRLLFPLIWHYLALPNWSFLILPQLGCLLTLGLAAHIVWADVASSVGISSYGSGRIVPLVLCFLWLADLFRFMDDRGIAGVGVQ